MNERKRQVEDLTTQNSEMKDKLGGLEKKIDTQNQELAKLKLQKQKIDG